MSNILDTGFMHPSEQIALVISRIYSLGLTTTSGGNISMVDEEGTIWITPSGIDKGSLTAADIIQVLPDGSIIGKHKPSSEFPFHKAIYDIRPDVKAVIHAHSPALVSFSIVRKIPHTNIVYQAQQVCGNVGYAEYALPGTDLLGQKIAEQFKQGYTAIIMENHGTVVGGSNMADVFQRFETLEFCARTEIFGNQIGTPKFLSHSHINSYHNFIEHQDGNDFETAIHPSDERALRKSICDIVKRACQHGLMKSSYGTVSARWRGNDFLITPTGIPRWDLQVQDIVQVKYGKYEKGKSPSMTLKLHKAIYEAHPLVNSIILTQSPYLMAFAITGEMINVRTIPESWIFLKDMPLFQYGSLYESNSDIVQTLSREHPAALIQNECVIVVGDKLLQTFDYLEVAEFSAKSIVMASSIGTMVPINDEQTEELRKAFLS